jgi:hypothetical protein
VHQVAHCINKAFAEHMHLHHTVECLDRAVKIDSYFGTPHRNSGPLVLE